jgi:hypothetical protein
MVWAPLRLRFDVAGANSAVVSGIELVFQLVFSNVQSLNTNLTDGKRLRRAAGTIAPIRPEEERIINTVEL